MNRPADSLEACPFCGHGDSLYVEHVEGTILHPAYYVRCDYCGAQSGSTDQGDHIEKWNTRPQPPAAGGVVAFAILSNDIPEPWKHVESPERAKHWHGVPGYTVRPLIYGDTPTPAAVPDAVRGLVGKWRDEAKGGNAGRMDEVVSMALSRCAEELEKALAAASESEEGKRVLCIRFGAGGVAVSTGTRNGEPAVFLREPPEPGEVGAPLKHPVDEMPLRVELTFPTSEQAVAVADALVTSAPPAQQDGQP